MKTKTSLLRAIEPLESRITPALTSAAIALSALTGLNGFTINGAADFDEAGTSVSDAGDVNGDGFADVIVGARFADEGGSNRGAAYVVFGNPDSQNATRDLATLNGSNGFKISGVADSDFAGQSVRGGGDINGDGFDDIIVGAPFAEAGADARGAAYVVFGKGSGFGASVSLADLNGSDGFKLVGENSSDNAGNSVNGAGDVNGDGYDDLLVGAPAAMNGGVATGAAYVVFGKAGAWAKSLSLGSLGSAGFKIPGTSVGQKMGAAVSAAGDVNGDGYDDIVVGSPQAAGGGSLRGAAYVIYGQKNSPGASFNVQTLDGNNGFVIQGVGDDDQAGSAVSAAGDVNGDGYADIVVGAQLTGGVNDIGAGYIVFGKPNGTFTNTLPLATLTGDNGFAVMGVTKNTGTGCSVSGAGDVNADGYADFIVGAQDVGGSGASYLVYGKSGGFTATLPLANLDGTNGFKLTGIDAGDNVGRSVSAAGDVNADGYADIIIGAPKADASSSNLGSAYVVYGGPSGSYVDPAISSDGKTATFTDMDGDLVKVKVTKGKIETTNFKLLQPAGAKGARVLSITLAADNSGGDLTISAKPTAAGGDGLVNIGFLDAGTCDFGTVKIAGNLETFGLGSGGAGKMGAKTFTVQSIGRTTQRAGDSAFGLGSGFNGAGGTFTVKGDVNQANLFFFGASTPKITIGGSLIGGNRAYSGHIEAPTGNLAAVKIGHDIIGGRGENTGVVLANGKLASIAVGGSLIGGSGFLSGGIGASSGIGSVAVAHDVRDGLIYCGSGSIGKTTIGGSFERTSVSGQHQVGVRAGRTLGPVLVKGDLAGTVEAPIVVSGRGSDVAGSATSLAIASLTVLGDVRHAAILAGYETFGGKHDGHGQIGAVMVKGDWIASSIAAGVESGEANIAKGFGNVSDAIIAGGQSSAVARIASITIKGALSGTAGGTDHYGFVAREIGALKIGATKFALHLGKGNDQIALGATGDFTLLELA